MVFEDVFTQAILKEGDRFMNYEVRSSLSCVDTRQNGMK